MTEQRARVTVSGDIHAEGAARDGRAHGEPVTAPETEWGAMLARAGGRDATPGEVADVLREHQHEMSPLDDDS
jgi:hypothetical protein